MVDLRGGEAWIGDPTAIGGMLSLPYVSSMEITHDRPSAEFRSLGGGRRVQLAPVSARQWQVELPGLRPDEIGRLAAFLARSPGPHWWVDPVARVTNLLPPEVASCADPAAWGDPTATVLVRAMLGRVWGQQLVTMKTTKAVKSPAVPALPGIQVSVQCLALVGLGGIPAVKVGTPSGALTGSWLGVGEEIAGGAAWWRMTWTGTIATGGLVWLEVPAQATIACPAITWTPAPRIWGEGMGAPRVVAQLGPRKPRAAWITGEAPNSSHTSLLVQEVS